MRLVRLVSPALAPGALMLIGACGSSPANLDGKIDPSPGPDGGLVNNDGGGIFTTPLGDGGVTTSTVPRCITATQQCVNACSGGGETTVTGTVYDPAGKNPLYGIVVYVPSETPAAITTGASCYSCNSLYTGNPIAYAVTDSAGKFTIHGVPDGANIPLVVQVGKWRMQYTLPSVTACQANDSGALLNDEAQAAEQPHGRRHPEHRHRDRRRRLARVPAAPHRRRRVRVRTRGRAAPDAFTSSTATAGPTRRPPGPTRGARSGTRSRTSWRTTSRCSPARGTRRRATATAAPSRPRCSRRSSTTPRTAAACSRRTTTTTGSTRARSAAEPGHVADGRPALRHRSERHHPDDAARRPALPARRRDAAVDDQRQRAHERRAAHRASAPQRARHGGQHGVASRGSRRTPRRIRRARPSTSRSTRPSASAPDEQCGRVVYSDLHVGAASGDYGGYTDNIPANAIVPTGCGDGDLSPQEKALEFMLFDLSGCITPPDQGAGGLPPPK